MNSSTITAFPQKEVFPTHGNAWSAAAVSVNGVSNAIDCIISSRISVFGNTSGASTITVQVSQDGTNFYSITPTIAANGNFHAFYETGARYVRLSSSAAVTITATIAGKG